MASAWPTGLPWHDSIPVPEGCELTAGELGSAVNALADWHTQVLEDKLGNGIVVEAAA